MSGKASPHQPINSIPYTDDTAKEFVKRFCARVHWMVSVRHIYQVLFEEEHPSILPLMNKTAPSFFTDLMRILHEYLLLECAKITDSATSGKYENFTVDFLVEKICWPDNEAILNGMVSLPDNDKDIRRELKLLQTVTAGFREHIKIARHKILAHLDKESVLSGKPFGEFPENEDQKFFDALQKLCNITHEACFGTIYGDMVPTRSGDVFNLIRALRNAVAFDQALSESTDENKTWLYSCLSKI